MVDFSEASFKPRTPEQAERAKLALAAYEALSERTPQAEIYAAVTFESDHVVGSERSIPLLKNELILAPGHLDILYQLKIVQKSELYKVTQTSLREGIQSGADVLIAIKKNLRGAFDGTPTPTTIVAKKEPDVVFGKIDLSDILNRPVLNNPEILTIFLQMIEQQAGQISLTQLADHTRREYATLFAQPNPSARISILRTNTEILVRRIVSQKYALHNFLKVADFQRPEIKSIFKLDGERKFTDVIDASVLKDLGPNLDAYEPEVFVQAILKSIFTKVA